MTAPMWYWASAFRADLGRRMTELKMSIAAPGVQQVHLAGRQADVPELQVLFHSIAQLAHRRSP
jgi:hypothetical protein